MNANIKKRLKRTAILSAIALIVGAGIGFVQIQNENAQVVQKGENTLKPIAGIEAGGGFLLIDQNGKSVTEKDFADKYKLIFFGFTYCPMICPTELQKMTDTLNALGAAGENIQPLFITVDPERDTPAVIKNYLTSFHPRIVGLTGTVEQIKEVESNYKVYASKAEDPALSEYTMDHSSFTYLTGPDDKIIALYRSEDTVEDIAADLRNRGL